MNRDAVFSQFHDLAGPDSAQKVSNYLATLPSDERDAAELELLQHSPAESLAGLNELGAYLLSLSDERLNAMILQSRHNYLSVSLAKTLQKYQPDRVSRLYKGWIDGAGDNPIGVGLLLVLVEWSYVEARAPLAAELTRNWDSYNAIESATMLSEQDPASYRELLLNTIRKRLTLDHALGSTAKALITHLGEAALPELLRTVALLQGPIKGSNDVVDGDASTSYMGHMSGIQRITGCADIGYEVAKSFPLNSIPSLIDAAVRSEYIIFPRQVATGINDSPYGQDGALTESPFALRLFKFLMEESPVPASIEQCGRWNKEWLAQHYSHLVFHPYESVKAAYQQAIASQSNSPESADTKPPMDALRDRLTQNPLLAPYAFALLEVACPCLALYSKVVTGDISPTESKLGGIPDVPAGFQWPTDRTGRAYSFVARLSENELRKKDPTFDGHLLFFANVDPGEPEGAVIHIPSRADLTPAQLPGTLYHELKSCLMTAEPIVTLPCHSEPFESWLLPSEIVSATGELGEAYHELREWAPRSGRGTPATAFGYPFFCQGNPKYAAEQRFSSLKGSAAIGEEFYRNTRRWLTLFSSYTNEEVGLCYHDTGTISFLITEEEFKARDFSSVSVNIDFM